MDKSEELFIKHVSRIVKELSSCNMLPFVRKEKALMMFMEFSRALSETYERSVGENDQKVLLRLNELDKLYEEREKERTETFIKLIGEIKNEIIKLSRIAFCRSICKYHSSVSDTTFCYCARRQKFVKSLEEDIDNYMQSNKERIITKYKDVSWKK